MDIDFKFDHTSDLSLPLLQVNGIRSTKWLEEVFFDPDSGLVEITAPSDIAPTFLTVGFSASMVPILYVFRFSIYVTSLYARKATKDEIKSYFCRFSSPE